MFPHGTFFLVFPQPCFILSISSSFLEINNTHPVSCLKVWLQENSKTLLMLFSSQHTSSPLALGSDICFFWFHQGFLSLFSEEDGSATVPTELSHAARHTCTFKSLEWTLLYNKNYFLQKTLHVRMHANRPMNTVSFSPHHATKKELAFLSYKWRNWG